MIFRPVKAAESGALQFPDGGRPTDRRLPLEKDRRPRAAFGDQIYKGRLNYVVIDNYRCDSVASSRQVLHAL
jgi:hypothetical protein